MLFRKVFCAFFMLSAGALAELRGAEKGALPLQNDPRASFDFDGIVGARSDANVANWLLPCPDANPGLLEMFAVRDRQPTPKLVPWAGEFVGKYLISAVQALRMENDPQLEVTVREVVRDVIASQAEDGYLGPFPQADRLKGNWDLWGHYHVMQALLLWDERVDDPAAKSCCLKAADLICRSYAEQGRSVLDAGSPEMNMAVIHVLARLYRETGEKRYLEQALQIERDLERAGDYLRTGLAGTPFYRTPRPRWESLHDLQGFVELYRVTGDEKYRRAFLNHWRSIREWDRRNSGGFSSGEQATGNPYEPTAIETCCTIAWMAISVDALLLSGDSSVADELELSTFNGMLGAQHPSGRWWTYNTPMDGAREASAHSIVFQSRAGTPELNCCSVNAPRGLGMLTEWGLLRDEQGPIVNYYGPSSMVIPLADGTPVMITQETEYPWHGQVRMRVEAPNRKHFTLRLRIPGWSKQTKVELAGETLTARPGSYLAIDREWRTGDVVNLSFDLALRYEAGDRQAAGQASLYRGPILLAYDQRHNAFDEASVPAIDLGSYTLAQARVEVVERKKGDLLAPWLLAELAAEGQKLTLCDFASAGAAGTRYRSWLPARNARPASPVSDEPYDGSPIPAGRMQFTWRTQTQPADSTIDYQVLVANDADFREVVLKVDGTGPDRADVSAELAAKLAAQEYFWKVVARNAHGASASAAKRFRVDPSLPPHGEEYFSRYGEGPNGMLVSAALKSSAAAEFGKVAQERAVSAGEQGGLAFDGRSSLVAYKLKRFPETDWSLAIWCRPTDLKASKLQEIVSAWTLPGDDPIRVCLDQGKLFARVESNRGNLSSQGHAIPSDTWTHLAAVKSGGKLSFYRNGEQIESIDAPETILSSSTEIGVGGNPRFSGDEYFAGELSGFQFHARALNAEEVRALAVSRPN